MALYGISLAEARLAAILATCKSLEQAASILEVSIHTVRSQLKSVLAKTGTHSQPELLMLLATGTMAHCCDELL